MDYRSKPRAGTTCPAGFHRLWRCHGTCHRCTHGTCPGTCHGRSRQHHRTCHGSPDGVQWHGMPWNCRGLQWNSMVLPWLCMDTAVWHCHALPQKVKWLSCSTGKYACCALQYCTRTVFLVYCCLEIERRTPRFLQSSQMCNALELLWCKRFTTTLIKYFNKTKDGITKVQSCHSKDVPSINYIWVRWISNFQFR